ncbi:MAG TPA: F0F1 ATP synthase subunit B [Beijerinckiaceae bacterium]|nr:F0F1 ATP synthase subunit B [Beijerinckiaceae bacterium]
MSFSFIGAAYAAGAPTGGGSFPPFDSSTFAGQLFWLAISFGLLYLMVSRVAIPRIGGIISDRRARIENDLNDAAKAQKAAEDAAKAFEANLAQAKAKAQGIAQAAREAASKEADARRHQVEAEQAAKLIAAEKSIAATKAKAMGNVGAIAEEAAAAIVDKLGGKAKAADIAGAVAALAKK